MIASCFLQDQGKKQADGSKSFVPGEPSALEVAEQKAKQAEQIQVRANLLLLGHLVGGSFF